MKHSLTISHLQDEIRMLRKVYPKLKDDSAFVLWFMRAYIDDSEDATNSSLTGESHDKGIDAILIDDKAKQVHIVQGKCRASLGKHSETRNDVLSFAELATYPWQSKSFLENFYAGLAPNVRSRFQQAVTRIRKNGYETRLYFVTTGRCTRQLYLTAKHRVNQAEGIARIFVFDAPQVALIYKNYSVGEAPAVPELILRVSSEGTVRTEGVIHRFDVSKRIDSWVFSMSSTDVGEMFEKSGLRLFARNIRGFLGKGNDINRAMEKTIRSQPENFWYYNNGVTIVCDEARREIRGGQDALIVERPQVINGQQTTRTLSDTSSSRASVLVKVIKVPRNDGDADEYDDLVSSIVRATNWQNYIKPSDMISNDAIQVYLERELRKRGYQYLRKRQSRSEARATGGGTVYFQIRKEKLAQAIAACELDPSVLLKGPEALFDERYYRSVFSSRSIPFYLSRYCLATHVLGMAHGHPERAYAKWLVVNLMWDMISGELKGSTEKRFRVATETYYHYAEGYRAIRHLEKAIIPAFRAALDFYKLNRGKGEEATDRQTFFKQSLLDGRSMRSALSDYWNASRCRDRRLAEKHIANFLKGLGKVEIDD